MDAIDYSKPDAPSVFYVKRFADITAPPVNIYFIGPNQFVNQSLYFLLKSSIDRGHTPVRWVPSEAAIDRSSGTVTVILIDCLECDSDAVQRRIQRHATGPSRDIRIVLFNHHSGCAIDQLSNRSAIWGYFYQYDCTADFIRGMHAVLEGRRWFVGKRTAVAVSPSSQRELLPERMLQLLSQREKEILRPVADGLCNIEIADALKISVHTAKTHVYRIYRKIEVPNRLQAVLWASAYLTGTPHG